MLVSYTYPQKPRGQLTMWLHGNPSMHFDTLEEVQNAVKSSMTQIVLFDECCVNCGKPIEWPAQVNEDLLFTYNCAECGFFYDRTMTWDITVYNEKGIIIN